MNHEDWTDPWEYNEKGEFVGSRIACCLRAASAAAKPPTPAKPLMWLSNPTCNVRGKTLAEFSSPVPSFVISDPDTILDCDRVWHFQLKTKGVYFYFGLLPSSVAKEVSSESESPKTKGYFLDLGTGDMITPQSQRPYLTVTEIEAAIPVPDSVR